MVMIQKLYLQKNILLCSHTGCIEDGVFDTELVAEFWQAFSYNAGCTLHVRQLAGSNSHHIIEGVYKSCARSIRAAVKIDPDFADDIPSTKGVL